MKTKIVSAILLTLLLLGMLTLAFNIQTVKASGTIYIRADGSIDPPTAPIQRVGDVYTFTADIYDEIVVERDNIVIDGDGYTLQGTGAYASKGVDLSGRSNVTIKNTIITAFYYGILLDSSSNYNSISGNSIANHSDGILLDSSSNNSISENNIENNDFGIELYSSSNNSISENNIVNNGEGIYLIDSSNNNSISGNNIVNNVDGIYLYSSSNNSISENNIVNNVDGIVLTYSSNNNSISGNNIENNDFGIELGYSSNNSISGNNIENNDYGIHLIDSSNNNRFYHNNFVSNTHQVYSYESINVWDDGYPSGGNYWSDYEEKYPDAGEIDDSGIWDTPYAIEENNQDNYPLMNPWGALPPPPDTTPPNISILSDETKTYATADVSLTFTVDESVSWMGYSLDGQANVTISGNTTLYGLPDGSHSLIVYARDAAGNTGASGTISFTIETSAEPPPAEPFPIWIVAVVIVIAALGTAVYLLKIRKKS